MKALLIIFTSLMLIGCIEEGTIVYDQDYPEAPTDSIGGSGSGTDRVPGDGSGSAGGTSDGSGSESTGGSTDGGVDGSGTSTGSDGGTTTGNGAGTDGGDTSTGSSDGSGSGSTGGSSDGSGSDGSGSTGSTGDGNGSGDGSSDGTDGGTGTDGAGLDGGDGVGTGTGDGGGSGSTGGSSDGSGSDGSGSTGSTGDGNGSGDGTTGGSTGGSTDGGTGTDGSGSDSGTGTDGDDDVGTDGGGDSGSGTGTGDGGGSGDGGDGSDNGTELDAPTVTLIPKEQKIVVSWSPVDNATSYNLRWQNADGTENIINVSAQQVANGADPIMFAHAPLVADTPYTYTVTAVAADGTEAVGTPLTGSALALGCNPSKYSPEGLVAYYNFEGNLNDSAGSYDLTATGDSIVYSNGCVNGKTGHFDGDGGYGYNLDFTDENVAEVADGSFSISVWVNADEDMNKWASVFSTTAVHENDELEADGWGKGFQLNVDGNMRPQLFACKHCGNNQKLTAPNQLQLNTWTHLAITVDNRNAKLYVDGALVGTHNKIDTEFNRLKVGLNRYGQQPWKGYADELMIFGDALTDDEMMSIYKNTLPGTPENVTAINWTGDAVVVGWDAVDGTNEYRVYYSTDGTVGENSPYITVTGGTVVNFDNLTQGQDYTYAVAGVSPLGVGELSAPATITVDSAEPVYVDKKVGFHYEMDYVNTNPSSSYNPASYNSHNFQVAEPNMRAHAYLFVAAGDKVKEHGMHINQYKTTITINDPASTFYKRQIDVVDKHGGWSYFNYTLITLDQTEFNNWALKTGKMECWGQAFNTIGEYTACNPKWVQAQKDKWVRDSGGSNSKKMLNDFIPVKDGYYTIEVKKYRGSQPYNYSKYDGVRNFTIVTQQ